MISIWQVVIQVIHTRKKLEKKVHQQSIILDISQSKTMLVKHVIKLDNDPFTFNGTITMKYTKVIK